MPKNIQHNLIAELKRIASELGRTPTRDEFRERSHFGEKAYRKEFGGFTPLVHAAGLKVYPEAQDGKAAFSGDMAQVEYDDTPRDPACSSGPHKILVLGDTHFPWVSLSALETIYKFIEANQDITDVVQVGDLYDMYSWAKFPRSHLIYTPKDEIEQGRKMAEAMWARIRTLLPRARLHQIMGNHDCRPMKKVMELAPEVELFVEIKKWWEFPGVKTYHDPREWLTIGNVHFTHGHLSGLGKHAIRYMRSVVCGHSHKGGCFFHQLDDQNVIFELNAGYLGAPTSRPLSYTAKKTVDWTLGFGVIDEWGPRFVSL